MVVREIRSRINEAYSVPDISRASETKCSKWGKKKPRRSLTLLPRTITVNDVHVIRGASLIIKKKAGG